ncbi:MAG: hypothetical protein KI792_12910 [Alphaproteobacteria bacterium]|nr:hypothetical protein [Alphaproteobacteria bacterium SS10]
MTDDHRATDQETPDASASSDAANVPADNTSDSDEPTFEVIPAQGDLKMRMGGRPGRRGRISEEVIENAERAIGKLGDNYIEVARSSVATLIGQFNAVKQPECPDLPGAIMQVAMTAREVKGQAKTCGYDLLTEVANSLYKFLSEREALTPLEIKFAEAHLGVMQNVVAHDLRGNGGPVGTELARSLAVAKQKLDAG